MVANIHLGKLTFLGLGIQLNLDKTINSLKSTSSLINSSVKCNEPLNLPPNKSSNVKRIKFNVPFSRQQ